MKEDRIYLLYAQDVIQHIIEYTAAGKDGFFADRKIQDAVVRNLRNHWRGDQACRSRLKRLTRHIVETHRRHER